MTDEQLNFIESFERCYGELKRTLYETGVDRKDYQKWRKNDKAFAQKIDFIRQRAYRDLTDDQNSFLEIYKKTGKNISHACAKCNISRPTFYNWVLWHKKFKDRVDEIDASFKDFSYSQMINLAAGISVVETQEKEVLDRHGNIQKLKIKTIRELGPHPQTVHKLFDHEHGKENSSDVTVVVKIPDSLKKIIESEGNAEENG